MLVDAQRSDDTRPEQINLDMEFAEEGGEAPTPYEVLLHAAMIGDSAGSSGRTASRKPGGSRPADREATEGSAVQAGVLGTEGRRPLGEGYGGWHDPWTGS